MPGAFLALAALTAVVAALRSTWSPCSLSMLSAMTPMGEQARGNRYSVTTAWFILGATVGGATLGLAAAGLAAGIDALDLSAGSAAAIAAVCALVCAASDARAGGFELPRHTRQVNEDWFVSFRRWVYAGGFGWQIGVGLSTFITTAAVYLAIVVAVLTASAPVALALGAGFGFVRGLTVLFGRPLTSAAAIGALHDRLDRWAEPSRRLAAGAQVVLAAAFAAVAGVPAVVCALGAVAIGGAVWRAPVQPSRWALNHASVRDHASAAASGL